MFKPAKRGTFNERSPLSEIPREQRKSVKDFWEEMDESKHKPLKILTLEDAEYLDKLRRKRNSEG